MSKKIKVSTVKQMADVEVLFINSNLISKAIRASIAAKSILDKMGEYGGSIHALVEIDEEGNNATDENGKPILRLDEDGNQMFDYSLFRMDAAYVEQFHKYVAPFIQELVEAFEAE